jgi:HD-like signal output (HDOD) protein
MPSLISTLNGGKTEFFALLKKRMSQKGDFPSLSKSVHDLAETMQNEDKNITEITGAILSDFTLTQKVIRLSNSAMYAGMGGEISTISKAAVVLGFDAIAHLALSVRFVDTISASAPDTQAARTEMSKALMAGDIARNITNKANLADGEEAVVCSLMHHLGRLLMSFYFPNEWAEIQKLAVKNSLTENQATEEFIGVTLDEISVEVAQSWRLPKKIANSMTSPTSLDGSNIPGSSEWLRTIANFAGEAASIVVNKGVAAEEMQVLAARYGDALLVPVDSIMESINNAVASAADFTMLEAVKEQHGKPGNAKERLTSGVDEITKALKGGMSFGNGLNLVLETMYGGMGFNRVAAFLRDGDTFKGRIGFGAMMPEVLPHLTFPEAYATDVFHLSLANKADVIIEDAAGAKFASTMPKWFTTSLPDVRSFVLLPMIFNGRPVGLLYGDWQQGTTGAIEKVELQLMRSLRDNLMKLLAPKS